MAQNKYKSNVEPKLELVKGWARDGLTDEQIAKNLGVALSTYYLYKQKHLEFSESLKEGKDIVDLQVENALLKRALGYRYEEKTKELKGEALITTKIVTKEIVPDTTAQIFWLKNRKPKQWRERLEQSVEDKKEQQQKLDAVINAIKGAVSD